MKTILLATDLSANSDRALERSLKIAKEDSYLLHILYVVTDIENTKKYYNKIKNYINNYKNIDSLNIIIDVVQSDKPYLKIPEFALEIKAEIIIMGTHKRAKFSDLFLGTTIERVLVNGSTPILMVKNKPTSSYKKILCGIDFAPASKKAFRTAINIAPKGAFEIIHTYINMPTYPNLQLINTMSKYKMNKEERMKAMDDFIEEEQKYFEENFNSEKLEISYEFINADPYYALIQESEKREVDLICVGAYADPSEKIGAVADSIIADPPCDVLISGAER